MSYHFLLRPYNSSPRRTEDLVSERPLLCFRIPLLLFLLCLINWSVWPLAPCSLRYRGEQSRFDFAHEADPLDTAMPHRPRCCHPMGRANITFLALIKARVPRMGSREGGGGIVRSVALPLPPSAAIDEEAEEGRAGAGRPPGQPSPLLTTRQGWAEYRLPRSKSVSSQRARIRPSTSAFPATPLLHAAYLYSAVLHFGLSVR